MLPNQSCHDVGNIRVRVVIMFLNISGEAESQGAQDIPQRDGHSGQQRSQGAQHPQVREKMNRNSDV